MFRLSSLSADGRWLTVPGMAENENSSVTAAEAPRRKGTLLIVDDELGPRVSLKMIFQKDYELLVAENGPEAIRLAEANRVDVAVCDVKMEGMSGIEVLERLKFTDPGMEVIIMTAFGTTETVLKALKLRACDFINKPFETENMRSIVATAMQRRTLASEVLTNSEKLLLLNEELQKHKLGQQVAQERNDIYGSVIHDINGPLTVISGFLQLIEKRIGNLEQISAKDLDFTRDKLKVVTRQATNCIEIARRYLTYLKKGAGTSLPPSSVNLLLDDTEHLLRVHPARLDNQFSIRPLAQDIGVKLNGTDVIQAVLNLVVNGFQCIPHPHRVEVVTEVLRAPLNLSAMKDSESTRLINVEGFNNTAPLVKLAVSDDGPGIPPEILPKIFENYFTTKGPKLGTGLGLSIVLRLIKEAGGALHVESRPGRGTTFTLFLPAVELGKPA